VDGIGQLSTVVRALEGLRASAIGLQLNPTSDFGPPTQNVPTSNLSTSRSGSEQSLLCLFQPKPEATIQLKPDSRSLKPGIQAKPDSPKPAFRFSHLFRKNSRHTPWQ